MDAIEFGRTFSSMAEWYEGRYGWSANLDDIKNTSYPNDFAMHNALRAEHKVMKNAHLRYTASRCYTQILTAFIPFDFGSTIVQGEQIIFIEGAPFLADLYAARTGIDVENLIGKKVVSINGVPAVEFFREFGQDFVSRDENDNINFMLILNSGDYSVRSSISHDFIPDQGEVGMVLESKNNQVAEVTLPWLFAQRSLFGLSQFPVTETQADFQNFCLAGTAGPVPPAALSGMSIFNADAVFGDGNAEKRDMIQRLVKGHKIEEGEYFETSPDFFEVPEGLDDKKVTLIVPNDPTNNGNATGWQFGQKTTVLKLANSNNWVDEVRDTIAYACENSKNLIIDIRGGGGGADMGDYIYRHITGDDSLPLRESGRLTFRVRSDVVNPGDISYANEFWRVTSQGSFALTGGLPGVCITGLEPGCFMETATETVIPPLTSATDPNIWNLISPVIENRGGVNVSLSRQAIFSDAFWTTAGGFPPGPRPTDISNCPGKFEGENMIILTDGTNTSGNYFMLDPFVVNNKATVVTMGGIMNDSDEDMSMGNARGGATAGLDLLGALVNLYGSFGFPTVIPPELVGIDRVGVDSNMEIAGVYRSNEDTLHVDNPVGFDVRLASNGWLCL